MSIVSPGYIKTQLSTNALSGDGSQHGVTDATTASGMEPHYVAHKIMMTIATGRRELLVAATHHKLAVYLKLLCPALMDWILQRRSKVN